MPKHEKYFDNTREYSQDEFGELISSTYNLNPLATTVSALNRAIQNLVFLYQDSKFDKDYEELVRLILSLEITMKTVHVCDAFAVMCLSYEKRTKRIHEPLVLTGSGEVDKLLKEMREGLNDRRICDIMGYVQIDHELVAKSCKLIRERLKKIGDFYLRFKDIYNRYKHGYGIIPVKWLREEQGKVTGHLPAIIILAKDIVRKKRCESKATWKLPYDYDFLIEMELSPTRAMEILKFIMSIAERVQENNHIRIFYPTSKERKVLLHKNQNDLNTV